MRFYFDKGYFYHKKILFKILRYQERLSIQNEIKKSNFVVLNLFIYMLNLFYFKLEFNIKK